MPSLPALKETKVTTSISDSQIELKTSHAKISDDDQYEPLKPELKTSQTKTGADDQNDLLEPKLKNSHVETNDDNRNEPLEADLKTLQTVVDNPNEPLGPCTSTQLATDELYEDLTCTDCDGFEMVEKVS